jgi:mRNA-degrading endonuclease RelE of RelBE toxin-antitoxin system
MAEATNLLEYIKMSEDPVKKPFPHNILRQHKYMYVWRNHKGEVRLFGDGLNELPIEYKYVGKIKLEVKDDLEL